MRLGKFKIFMFVKPSSTATMSTHRVGQFLSSELDEPIIHDESIASEDLDTLIIVAGGAAFSNHRDDLGRAALRSDRIIYVSLDYQSRLPNVTGSAQTMYRKAFRLRHKRGMSPPDHWTTCELKSRATPGSVLINWNALEYNPTFNWQGGNKELLYYGSWRKNRIKLFDQYFRAPDVPTVLSNGSGRFQVYDACRQIGSLPRDGMAGVLASVGLGLYLMDPQSDRLDHFPAGRFYEMLGAGLPMVFDDSCVSMLGRVGYDVSPFVTSIGLRKLMRNRKSIAEAQAAWREDFVWKVRQQLRGLVR